MSGCDQGIRRSKIIRVSKYIGVLKDNNKKNR